MLAQIEEAARDIGEYVAGMTQDDFFADKRTKQAVVLNLIIIGETAAKLIAAEPAFVASYADIPWQQMRGMRNRIAHGYFDIDFRIVWDTVRADIPDLLQRIVDLRDG
ncbi:DUF86 domain-containing protein [Rudaea sp.]|uniref:HepT-like ribonuclease domain-containing protein n=1 Tax=Rudaea sp. TaxID=2136325 RepID=UPI00321F7132